MADKCNTYNNVLDDLLDIMCSEHKGRPFYNICRNHHRDYIEGDNENKLHSKNLKDLFLQNIVMGYINANYQEIFNETSTQIFLKNLIKSNEDCSIPTPYCGGENANELEIETCLNATNAETKIKEIRCPNKKLPGHTDNDNGFNGVRYDNDPYSEENKDCQILHNVLKKNCFIQNSPDFIQNKEAFKKCIDNYGDEFISNIIHNNKDKDNNIDREKLVCLNEKIIKVINENLEDFINLSANDNLLLNGGGTSYTNTDFDMVDTDNDTVISSEELINYENSKTKRLNFFDADKDGEIDATEWPMNNANFNFVNQSGSKINNDELIIYQEKYEGNREFQFYDINNDGSISEGEWDKDKDKSMKDYNYDRIKELLYKKLREEIESEGKNFNDYIADDIHYNGSNFKDVILSGSLKHIKNKFIEYRDDLCSIRIDTINEGSNILPIDDIKYGKIGTADGLYGKIGDTYGSYGLIGDKQDDYISINNCISNTEINDSKTDVFKDILLKVKDRNDDFIKLVNDNDIYSTSNIYLTSNNYLNEYSDRYLNEISYDNFTKLNIYNDYILNNDYDYKSSKMAEIDNYYNDYSERINKYPDSTIECKHIDDYNDLNVCRNSEETCTPNLISEDRIDVSLEPYCDDLRECIFLKSLEPKKDDLRQYIFHNQSNIYVDKLTIIDGLTWTKVSTRPNIGMEIGEIITNKAQLSALKKALNAASVNNPEQIFIDDIVYGNNSIDLNQFDNNTYWEKLTDVYYKLNIRHDSCKVPSNYKQQNSEDICGEDLVCAYKNQYENSINEISQYTDCELPMSCEDKLSNLDYCYNNDANIKAELETTFVDYTTCEDDNSNDPIISSCNPIKECDIGYFREFIQDGNDSYTCEIDCTQCTNKPDNNSHYISSNVCHFRCDDGFEYNVDNLVCYKLCPEGQKRESQDTCEDCPADEYKDTISTSTSCSPCPFGSTTNGDTGSTSIDSCVAIPGYEDDDNDNQYTLKPGNYDDDPSGTPDGIIDRCGNGFYYNAGTNECETCGPFGDGIECTGGDIIDQTNYPKRKLKNGYGLSNNISYSCEGDQYRDGDIVIDYYDTSQPCNTCPTGSTGNNNTTDIPNDDCILYAGYKFNENESNSLETTLKPGNYDDDPSGTPDGIIDRCGNGFYYNGTECVTCDPFEDGIECQGGDIIYKDDEVTNYPKRKLLSGHGLNNNTSYRCVGDQYRNGDIDIVYDVASQSCNTCPTGSIGNNGTEGPNTECTLLPGYEWKNEKDTPLNYETTLEPGNFDDIPSGSPDGTIDRCGNGYYYNGTECIDCTSFGDGIECTGGDIIDQTNYPKRKLKNGYGLSNNISYLCQNEQYRLGKREVQDGQTINCNSCPIGTSYDGKNGCQLTIGYSWPGEDITNNLYNEPLQNSAYDYQSDVAIGCTSGNYNIGDNECTQCPVDEGIDCSTNRPFKDANMTLKPNYSWDNTDQIATKCPKGEKRQEYIAIGDSNITCDLCDYKPDYSQYDDNEGNQSYNSDGSCQWICDSGYQRYNNECLKKCDAGYKRNDNTCVPCSVNHYKDGINTLTECTQCPIGSTTNSNETATFITDCTARPGYIKDSNDRYTPKLGNIDNQNLDGSEGADGRIDSCAYNFGFNSQDTEDRECTSCPNIDNGGYDENETPNNCTNIICDAGYELNEGTCQPCGRDRYKEGTNNNECTQCPIGSTTNSNETATVITDCTARPGYEDDDYDNIYTPIQGNIDNQNLDGSEGADGRIDSCAYNFGFNSDSTENRECTICPTIDYGGYDQNLTPNNCSNKICNSGYELINMTCQPCGRDRYKEGTNNNECTQCPIGSTTNSNETATFITDCTARPGYEDDDYNNIYTPKLGNIDNDENGIIDACYNNFYYDSTNGECVSCVNYGNGIDCTGGPINDSKRMLQSGYSWDGSTAEPCDDKYRLGKVEVQDEELIVCNDCPTGTSYDGYNGCVLNTGYSWSDTTERTDTLYNDPIKDNIAYYYSGDEATGCTIGHYNDYNTVYNDCTQCPDDEGIDCSTNRPFVNANMILQPNYSWISGTAQQCDNYNIRHNIQEITNIGDITCEPCELNEYKYDLTCKPIPPRHYKKSDGDITEVPANRISSGNIALTDIIVNQIILEYTSDSLDTIPTINLTYQDITTNLITNNLISIDTDLINKKIYYDINTYYIKIKDIQDISIDNDEIIITKIIAKTNDGNYYLLAEPQLETFTNYNLEGFTDGQRSIYNKQTLYENTTQKSCPLGTYVNADANVCQYPKDGQILSGNTAQDCPIGSIVKDEGLFDNRDCGYAISGYYTKDKNTYYPCAGDEYQDLERQDTCKPEPGYDTDNISSRPYTFITNNGVNIGVELNRGYSYDYTTKNITECPLDYYREEKTVINNETDITCTPCGPNQITFTKASTSEDNCKDECLVDYYFNNNDNECQTCGPFGNGIECPGGDLIDEAHRYLKAGYKWTGTESELCDPGYYRGNDTTQGPIVYDGTEIPCDGCPTGYSINYTPSSDNLIKSIGECLYDVCEDDEYRDDSNVCQSISPQDCTGDQIHFLGIAENNDTNYPDEHITYDDITAETYQSYDSTCYPGQDAKYFVADDTYSPYFETFAV